MLVSSWFQVLRLNELVQVFSLNIMIRHTNQPICWFPKNASKKTTKFPISNITIIYIAIICETREGYGNGYLQILYFMASDTSK